MTATEVPSLLLSPWRVLVWSLLIVVLAITGTEFLEPYLKWDSGVVDGAVHVLVLVMALYPMLYFFWHRPLMQQIAKRRKSEEEGRGICTMN
jgi:hypothetical protein